MKLSTQNILRLTAALQSFDGLHEVVDGKPVKSTFKLSAPVKMKIARNLSRLQEVIVAYQKTRNGLIYMHGNGANQLPDPAKCEDPAARQAAMMAVVKFEQDDQMLKDALHEVDLILLKEADLDLDANPHIPVTTIAALEPIIMVDPAASQIGKTANANGAAEHATG